MNATLSTSAEPIITIIVVTFNPGDALEETIRSVEKIDRKNLRLVIIDGGSTDGTLQTIEKYKNAIDYAISEPDKGIYDAFNKGWKAADPQSFILYLGAGDKILSLPTTENLQNSNLVYGNVFIGDTIFRSKVDGRLRLGNTIHHQALLVRKSVHPDPPFDIRYKTYADFDFNQRLYKQKLAFTFDPNFSSYALPGGVSHKFNVKESLSIVRKNFGIITTPFAALYYLFQAVKSKSRFRIEKT